MSSRRAKNVLKTHVHDPDGVGDQHSGGTYGEEEEPRREKAKNAR